MNDIMKIVQALENSNVLLKGVTKINKSEIKEQKARFLSMLVDTLRASLLGNLWTGKGAIAKRKVRGILAGYGAKRACYGLKKKSDSTSSFHKLWNLKILWKWTQI